MITGVLELSLAAFVTKLADEIHETATAALDVCFEKQSFNALSNHLRDIHLYLKALDTWKLEGSSATLLTLQALKEEVAVAYALIRKVGRQSQIYNFLFCRSIIRNLEKAVRDIGLALQALKIATAEISVEINERIELVKEEMLKTAFSASEGMLEIVDNLEHGLREQRFDQRFANDILNGIASNLGLPQEPFEISRELACFQRDKEKAVQDKQLQEEKYLEQVIALLSRADAAYSLEASKKTYLEKRECIASTSNIESFLEPYSAFKCPMTGDLMTDPVKAASNTTYERRAVELWLDEGNCTDPLTNELLANKILKPNRTLMQSISEWREQNYVARILKAKCMLESGDEIGQESALLNLSKLCEESYVNKDWISFEGLVPLLVDLNHSPSHRLKEKSLSFLCLLGRDNRDNQELIVADGGVAVAVRSLGGKTNVAKAAALLLAELINNESGRSMLEDDPSAFVWLGTYSLNEEDSELMEMSRQILDRLSNKDKNIIKMAKVNWCSPLIRCLCQGSDESKLAMASTLAELNLDIKSKQLVLEGPVVSQLVQMLEAGDLRTEAAALRALQKLSSYSEFKSRIAHSGAVPLLLNVFSHSKRKIVSLEEPVSEIMENLASCNGLEYFVDANTRPLPEKQVVQLVLEIVASRSGTTLLHALNTLLGFAHSSNAKQIAKLIRDWPGIPLILSLVETSHSKVRDSAVQLLSYLSQEDGGTQIASFFSRSGKLGSLVEIMRNDVVSRKVQSAAAEILTQFPLDETNLKVTLLSAKTLDALISMLATGDPLVSESSLGALLRFLDSSDIKMQLELAQLGIFPLLNVLLRSGSSVSRIRAASILKFLSSSSMELIQQHQHKGCICFGRVGSVCKVHTVKCEPETTLCILEAKAVPELVAILGNPNSSVVEAGIDALFTLVEEDMVEKAVRVLNDAGIMKPLLNLINNGSTECSLKAKQLMKIMLTVPKIRANYSHIDIRKLSSITNGN